MAEIGEGYGWVRVSHSIASLKLFLKKILDYLKQQLSMQNGKLLLKPREVKHNLQYAQGTMPLLRKQVKAAPLSQCKSPSLKLTIYLDPSQNPLILYNESGAPDAL